MSGQTVLDFLRGVPFFKDLPRADLESLCAAAKEIRLAAGEQLFKQGEAGDYAYLIEKGDVEIARVSDGREVPLAIRRTGEMVGEMALLEKAPRMAGARALTDSVLLAIGGRELEQLLDASPSAARIILATIATRLRETQAMLMQSEKMAQLGILTAGMAHELNNPASAVLRGAEHLRAAVEDMASAQLHLGRTGLAPELFAELSVRVSEAREAGARAGKAMAEAAAPIETLDAIEAWLEKKGLTEIIRRAPELGDIGYTAESLDAAAALYSPSQLPSVLLLVSSTREAQSLLAEISAGARQVADIVKALKSYVYLDQGPVQEVDVHEGLENTMIILKHKLAAGITVRRDYARDLPRVFAHGGELNQVWTNLIDNAADALQGKGEIIVRTRRQDGAVTVEVEDNGPGVPPEIASRVFTLFFTTKPLGKGSGQGLNISYGIVRRHGGEITFTSRPGKTVFAVRIPIVPPRPAAAQPAQKEG
jgi:signal transduction histidine kinase